MCWIACIGLVLAGGASFAQEPGREPFRPQFHFTPARHWMNDPNGMVYYNGEWHLFYQYNPFGNTWGHMSWGHAVSRDLVRWEHLPLALAEEDGIMIFSGSAVVDWKNSTGFGRDGKPPLVAIYTGHREGRQDQRLASSNDQGRTWTKYSGNPVLDVKMADFRDPKVFWHEGTSKWIMTVALSTEKKVHFYASDDLKSWKYTGEFGPSGEVGGLWECPDLFPLSVGDTTKWVLIVNINPGGPAGGSACQYFIGSFDGARFAADAPAASRAEFVPAAQVLADFENGYAGWVATGDAFGAEPAQGTLPNQQPVTNYRGRGLVNSFRGGDAAQGTLTSPPFEITHDHISFLIGGGRHAETCLDLRVDGKVVRTARGREREQLAWQSWDVSEFRGKQATIQVVDKHGGGWGHINVDHILLADQPARPADDSALWADYGTDFYAGVSWSDVPKSDGRRVWLGWMSNWQYANDVPTSPWRSVMSIPRELRLKQTPDGYRLTQQPVQELRSLRKKQRHFDGGSLSEANRWIAENKIQSQPLEMQFELDLTPDDEAGIKLFSGAGQETVIGVNRQENSVFVDRRKSGNVSFHPTFASKQVAPLGPGNRVKLRIFLDACSVEVFVNDGEQVITSLIFPSPSERQIEFAGATLPNVIRNLDVWPVSSR